jgi:hypothetical protein
MELNIEKDQSLSLLSGEKMYFFLMVDAPQIKRKSSSFPSCSSKCLKDFDMRDRIKKTADL